MNWHDAALGLAGVIGSGVAAAHGVLVQRLIRGSRITVELILRKISEEADEKALLQAYPRLTSEDIKAALRYAADTLAHEEVLIIPSGQ